MPTRKPASQERVGTLRFAHLRQSVPRNALLVFRFHLRKVDQKGRGVSLARLSARMARWVCQPPETFTIALRSARRLWVRTSRTSIAERRQLEGDLRLVFRPAPGHAEQARRIALCDAADEAHAVLECLEALGRRLPVRRKVGVMEGQLHATADAQIHVAGGEPFGALVRIREIGPDALDRVRAAPARSGSCPSR